MLLLDTRPGVRCWAAENLSKIGLKAAPYAQELASVLCDSDVEVREFAAKALGSMPDSAAPHAAALAGLLRDRSKEVRYRACWALGKIGPSAAPHVVELVRLLKDEYVCVSSCAAKAIVASKSGTKHEAAALASLTTQGFPDYRRTGAWALGELRDLAVPHLDALALCLHDVDAGVRRCAAEAFGKIGSRASKYASSLEQLLVDDNVDVRHWANWSLSEILDPC